MDLNSKSEFTGLCAEYPSSAMKWTEEKRLCRIIESEQTSSDEKYQALMDLAKISGVLVRGLADAA
jgi:hypothetical protein